MARKKAYTDALNNIISYNKSRIKNASRSLNLNNPEDTDNAVTYNALRNRRVNNSSKKQSNLLSEKELLHEKYYDSDGNLNLTMKDIYGANFDQKYNAPTYDININFDLTSIPITSYDPSGNENDRPRINTFREDANYIEYLSAGGIYEDPASHVTSTPPWGNRSTGLFSISIPINDAEGDLPLSAGIDVFTADYYDIDLVPSVENWNVTTPNPGEKKYQLLFNTAGTKDVSVTITTSELALGTEDLNIIGTESSNGLGVT